MLNLDTHILIHALRGNLRPRELQLLSENRWGIASVCLWELAKLAQLGRIRIDLEDTDVKTALSAVHVWPLDLAVARTSTQLDFQGDPADAFIGATSIVHRVPLVTRDQRILASRLVPLAV